MDNNENEKKKEKLRQEIDGMSPAQRATFRKVTSCVLATIQATIKYPGSPEHYALLINLSIVGPLALDVLRVVREKGYVEFRDGHLYPTALGKKLDADYAAARGIPPTTLVEAYEDDGDSGSDGMPPGIIGIQIVPLPAQPEREPDPQTLARLLGRGKPSLN